jgi:membrane associated rhomboid family serine protease
MSTYAEPTVSGTLKSQAKVLGIALAAMYVMFFATWMTHGALLSFGIIPRSLIGLRGILFAPFLHGSLAHLLANSIPFAILGWLVMLRDSRHFTFVTVAAMIASGGLAWLIGASGSVHVGASGVIFGYLGFLIFSGWYSRSFGAILLSILAVAFWGGLIFGVLPGHPGISWQAHLGGFLGGVYSARQFRGAA